MPRLPSNFEPCATCGKLSDYRLLDANSDCENCNTSNKPKLVNPHKILIKTKVHKVQQTARY